MLVVINGLSLGIGLVALIARGAVPQWVFNCVYFCAWCMLAWVVYALCTCVCACMRVWTCGCVFLSCVFSVLFSNFFLCLQISLLSFQFGVVSSVLCVAWSMDVYLAYFRSRRNSTREKYQVCMWMCVFSKFYLDTCAHAIKKFTCTHARTQARSRMYMHTNARKHAPPHAVIFKCTHARACTHKLLKHKALFRQLTIDSFGRSAIRDNPQKPPLFVSRVSQKLMTHTQTHTLVHANTRAPLLVFATPQTRKHTNTHSRTRQHSHAIT